MIIIEGHLHEDISAQDVAEQVYLSPSAFSKRFFGYDRLFCIRAFLPLNVKVTVQGRDKMDYKITKMFGFKVIGFGREFSFDTAYEQIQKH